MASCNDKYKFPALSNESMRLEFDTLTGATTRGR